MRALALDPGKTTGYSVAYCNDDMDGMELEVGEEVFSLQGLYEFIDAFLGNDNDRKHIIYEDFQYRNYARSGLDLTPVKMIGIIELYRERFEPFVTFTKQTAATGKAFWSDDKLKKKGIHAKGRKHGRDATRHLMQWLAFGAGSQYMNIEEVTIKLEVG